MLILLMLLCVKNMLGKRAWERPGGPMGTPAHIDTGGTNRYRGPSNRHRKLDLIPCL